MINKWSTCFRCSAISTCFNVAMQKSWIQGSKARLMKSISMSTYIYRYICLTCSMLFFFYPYHMFSYDPRETNSDHQSHQMFSKGSLESLAFLCHSVEGVIKSCILYHWYHYCSITCVHEISQASAALGSASNVHIVQSKRCHGDLHMPHNGATEAYMSFYLIQYRSCTHQYMIRILYRSMHHVYTTKTILAEAPRCQTKQHWT